MFRFLSAAGVALAVLLGSPFLAENGLAQLVAQEKKDEPKKDEPKKDEPKKPDEPKKDEPKKDEPKKDEPKKDEPKKDEPKKDEPKKDEPKKDEPKKDEPKKSDASSGSGAASKKAASKSQSKIKPYDEIVTNDFKTSPGLFLVHKSEDKILYEIPTDTLGKDMVWVRSVEKATTGSYGGFPLQERVVRWEQRGDDILLRDVKYDIRADTKDPIRNAVERFSLEPIIAVLPVKAYGKDKAPVIDATELFTTDMPEFSFASAVGGAGADVRKTFIESVKAFPENIETKVFLTFRRGGGGGMRGPGGPPAMPGAGGGSAITILAHHSMVKLPEDPMKPRRYDDRVGFFTEDFQDYGDISNHQVENVRYINRWRLEKKDPNAEVSEPKKPIVFYIGREVPDKFRPAIKKGVEAWQPAFEKAGFKNAILCKDAPTVRENPDWDAEDARYSSLRWIASTTENAMGPHIHDPRTGEIIESDIILYHNLLKLARDWYFVQASPNDERAQKLPLPDDLVSDLVTYIVSHEVGHTLGFPHNMKASSSYSVEQLRDPKFTAENGTEASIMDYGRFNYVAQPGDGAKLIPVIGPYDKFAVEWGYRQFPGADTYEKEKAELDKIVARQLKDRTLLFGYGGDPSSQTEDLSDDAVRATELGLKNIDRVASYLVKATSKKGEDYDQLQNMYTQLVSQRNRELMHVVSLVGGTVKTNFFYGDRDKQYDPIPADQQKKAVAFLVANAFTTPKSLIAPDIVQRLEPNGAADRILNAQRMILRLLINEGRIKRLAEQVANDPKNSYAPSDMLADLRNGIWSDLKGESPDLDLYRRNLQRAHAEALIGEVVKDTASSDLPALARGELKALLADIDGCKDKKMNPATRMFLDDMRARIAQALEPKTYIHTGGGGGNPNFIIFGGDVDAPKTDF